MKNLLAEKLGFFRDCYDSESQEKILWNVYSTQIDYARQLALGAYDAAESISLPVAYAEKVAKAASHYHREKQLLFCRYFIVAKIDSNAFGEQGKKRTICSPVFYFPASVENDKASPSLKVDLEDGVINPAVINFFDRFGLNVEKKLTRILEALSTPEHSSTVSISDEINALLMQLQQSAMGVTIELIADNKLPLKDLTKNATEANHYINLSSLVCLIRKQQSAQGVLHELEQLSDRRAVSAPLAHILQERSFSPALKRPGFFWFLNPRKRHDEVPAVLSTAQKKAMDNAANHALSLMIGPPGTGKSFTIACIALSEFMQGKSVLIVSQNQHAVDVVRNKLINDFGIVSNMLVVGSDKGISKQVKRQIEEILSNVNAGSSDLMLKQATTALSQLLTKAQKAEQRFVDDSQSAVKHEQASTDWNIIRKFFSYINRNRSDLVRPNAKPVLLTQQLDNIEELDSQTHELIAQKINIFYQKIKAKAGSDRYFRKSLRFFSRSLSARTATKQNEYYQSVEYSQVLTALPIWFSCISNLHRLLPLKKELFDTVIIDEATQCNMAVCIPALYRAKRAVIVGDPKQLKHVSFVSYKQQQTLFAEHGLTYGNISDDYRNNSVIEYALSAFDDVQQIVSLDEHYRSHPQIINFSNAQFYNESLKIMTSKPGDLQRAVKVVQQPHGKRKSSINRVEAEAVIADLRELIDAQKNLPDQQAHSVGVLSFFRDQARYLEKCLFDQFTLNELRKHNIRCGTPFAFQGEERDIMLISCCVDENTAAAAYNYLNRDDVFNVAITRARDIQKLFLSCPVEQINPQSLLRAYVQYCEELTEDETEYDSSQHDAFQNEVCQLLEQSGVKTVKNYLVAGTSIDIVAVYKGKSLAIDLIGFAGALQGALPLDRYKLLNRAGLPSFLLPYGEWQQQRVSVLELLAQKLGLAKSGLVPGVENEEKPLLIDFSQDEQEFLQLFDLSLANLNSSFVKHEQQRAQQQLTLFIEKYRQYIALLTDRFSPEELTYKRYFNAFKDLMDNSFGNLSAISSTLDLISSMLEQEQSHLNLLHDEQMQALHEQRLSLIEQQQAKVQKLMLQNESALLQMDKTLIKLMSLQTDSANEQQTIAEAEQLLEEMTNKLDLYANTNKD